MLLKFAFKSSIITILHNENYISFQSEEQVLGERTEVMTLLLQAAAIILLLLSFTTTTYRTCQRYTECNSSALRYGGLSVGGQLPILDVDPKDIHNVFRQLGRMLNITGVIILVL